MPLILSLLLSVSCAFAKAKPKLKPHTPAVKPQLLKYSQIMRLSKTKRITYLRRIGHLLVMLERPQAKFESADAREILKQFAAFLPEAYAEDALLDVPAETAEPAAAAAAAPAEAAVAASSPGACAKPEAEQCPEIKAGSPEETDMINAFKSSSANNECIRGGFFGRYKGNSYSRGHCEIDPAAIAEMNKALGEDAANCKTGAELCNPVLFCWGYDKTDKSGFRLGKICSTVNQTFTANCEADYQDHIDTTKDHQIGSETVKYRACDPANDLKGLKFQDSYNNLIEQTKAAYERLCGGVAEFKAKFCSECNVIRSHIAKANCEAGIPLAAVTTDQKPTAAPESSEVTQ